VSVREFSSGDHHTVLLSSVFTEPKVFTFGSDCQYGQLGVTKYAPMVPNEMTFFSGVPLSQVSCGSFHTAVK
jgi:alpha-tubulin suppressor-like RCC1 family protein